MLVLGLDIATQTGWSVLDSDDNSLIAFGSIQINPSMTLPQKINFLSIELTRVLEKYKPDYVFMEDLICGISGVKTLSYLGRLNGAAILTCCRFVDNNIKFFSPPCWKKNGFENLSGLAKKWEVQLAVINHFHISLSNDFYVCLKNLKLVDDNSSVKFEQIISKCHAEIDTLKKKILSKKTPPSENEKQIIVQNISTLKKKIDDEKKSLKKYKNEFEKRMVKISLEITSKTSISPDIADSIGVALCGIKELNK